MTRIGVMKLGRSITLDDTKFGFQGDIEAPNHIMRLAQARPDVTFVVIGKHTKEVTINFPSNVEFVWPNDISRGYVGLTEDNKYKCVNCDYVPVGADVRKWLSLAATNMCCDATKKIGAVYAKIFEECFYKLDGLIVHLGQHGTSSSPIPKVDENSSWDDPTTWTTPQVSTINYVGYATQAINLYIAQCINNGKEPRVVYVSPDPRNFVKDRALAWPNGLDHVLGQGNDVRAVKLERYGLTDEPPEGFTWVDDDRRWAGYAYYDYAGTEFLAVTLDAVNRPWVPFSERIDFAVSTTSVNVKPRRSEMIVDWVLPAAPDAKLYGKWDDVSLADLPEDVTVTQNPTSDFVSQLMESRMTIALPIPGPKVGWATAKIWQAFAVGTICFLPPGVDDDGFVVPLSGSTYTEDELWKIGWKSYSALHPAYWSDFDDDDLWWLNYLRVNAPQQLEERVKVISKSPHLYDHITRVQRKLFDTRWKEQRIIRKTFEQLGV